MVNFFFLYLKNILIFCFFYLFQTKDSKNQSNENQIVDESLHLNNSINQQIAHQRFSANFFKKFHKDVDNLDIFYKKCLKRFVACCSSLSYMLEPLNEETVLKIKCIEIIKFLKRVFLFDFKRLVKNSMFSLSL